MASKHVLTTSPTNSPLKKRSINPYPKKFGFHIDPKGLLKDVQQEVRNAAIQSVVGWPEAIAAGAAVEMEQFKQGITNLLFLCRLQLPQKEEEEVKLKENKSTEVPDVLEALVRVFGSKTSNIVDRPLEHRVVVCLGQLGVGPQIYGEFEDGLVYQFFPGKALRDEDLSVDVLSGRIAETVADWHALEMDIGASKEPIVWKTIHKWLDVAREAELVVPQGTNPIDLEWMSNEAHTLCLQIEAQKYSLVVCHHDLLAGNFVLDGSFETGSLRIIDYEYTGYDVRGFDLGNHFNEWAGFDLKWENYPTLPQQEKFVEHYLRRANKSEPTKEQVTELVKEANVCSLASHLFWGSWALAQSTISGIDFNYYEYAAGRFKEYLRRKEECLQMMRVR